MKTILEEFKKEADILYNQYEKQAKENINLGNSKKKRKLKDHMLFLKLFAVYSKKINKLADSYEEKCSEKEKIKLNSLAKEYMYKFYIQFKSDD